MTYNIYTQEQCIKYWYNVGYNDYLNSYPFNTTGGSSYCKGWKDAQHDYMVAQQQMGE